MNYFIREFLGSKIMIALKTVIIFHLSEILRDPLWGPQDRTFWDSPIFISCPVWPCVQKYCSKNGLVTKSVLLPVMNNICLMVSIRSRFGSSYFWFKRGWIGG